MSVMNVVTDNQDTKKKVDHYVPFDQGTNKKMDHHEIVGTTESPMITLEGNCHLEGKMRETYKILEHQYGSWIITQLDGSDVPTSDMCPFLMGDPTLSELRTRKSGLKLLLKQYDLYFYEQHGRSPNTLEKEPLRHFYEKYKVLKSMICFLEQGFQLTNSTCMGKIWPADSLSDPPPPRNVTKRGLYSRKRSSRSASRKILAKDLVFLAIEKQLLREILLSYEKKFIRNEKRQVFMYEDILPVVSHYRRYQEIKNLRMSI